MDRELRTFRFGYAIWLFGIFGYFVPAATWNPVSRFDLTRAIVEQHTFQIDTWADDTGDRAWCNGHWYTDKAPVPAFLAVPWYAVFQAARHSDSKPPQYLTLPNQPERRLVVDGTFARALYVSSLGTAALAGVAIALLAFEWLRKKTSLTAAFVGSFSTILATPILPYATSFYGHVIAGAFLFAGFFLLFDDAHASPKYVRWAAAFLVLAGGSEYVVTVPATLILIWAIARARDRVSIVRDLALGAAIPIIGIGAYHFVCFGSPFRTGYSFIVKPLFAQAHASGLLGVHLPSLNALGGLLIGTRRGLFYLAPMTALATALLGVRAARAREPDVRLAAGAFLLLLLINAGYYMWWGGAATGPRHLVPVIPFLALGAALAWETKWLRVILIILVIISAANMLALTAVGLEAPEKGNALRDYAWPHLMHGAIADLTGASNVGLRLGLPRSASLAPLVVWIGLGLRWLARALHERKKVSES